MGRKITVTQQVSTGGGSAGNMDPYDQPCFSAYNGSYNYSTGWFTWDHNLNVHNWIIGDNNCYSQYRSDNSSQNTEFINDQGSNNWMNSWSQPHSSTDRVNCTSYTGYLGHSMFLGGSTRGGSTPWFTQTNGSEYRSYGFRDVCTLPGETDQDYGVFMQWGGTLRLCSRSTSEYWMGVNYNKLPYFNIPNRNMTPMYGGSSYNRKKNYFCVMETNDSYTFQPVVWKNVPNFRTIAHEGQYHWENSESYSAISMSNSTLQTWFNTGANQPSQNTYSTQNGKPTNQTTEDRQRGIVTMCDNERIVMHQMIPSYGAWCTRWNSPSVDGNGNNQGSIYNFNGTTSYGIDQGTRYGARWTQTSDGRYVAMYCPYYYYGAGLQISITRVSDGKTLMTNYTDSSAGYCPVPFGKSNFLMVSSRNTDGGEGMRFTQFNCDYQFAVQNDSSDVNMLGAIDASGYQFDSTYHSTSYPGIIPAIYNTSLFNTELSTDYSPTVQA